MSEKTRDHLKPSLALSIGIIILITAVVSAAT